jgi:cyclopropane fatty-acyl-phospholipid synthase-like methyltransferase
VLLTLALALSIAQRSSQPVRVPDIGYEPTPLTVVDAMLKMAGVGPTDTVYDLGSGDGRIPLMAAQRYGARGVGIEIQPALVRASKQTAHDAGVDDKVTFVEQDFFDADLSPATVVILYLWPGVNDALEPKLRRELRPGARIVSYTFGMTKWVPDKTVHLENGRDLSLWIVPRRPAREPDVPFTATPQPIVESMLQLARVGPDDVVLDLGSGDGRIPIVAAQTYHARGVGIELVPELVERSRRIAREAEIADRVRFLEGDLFDADLSDATVVTLYLSPDVNAKLEARLRRLRRGTRIVSRHFPIGEWVPDATIRAGDGSLLRLWIVK